MRHTATVRGRGFPEEVSVTGQGHCHGYGLPREAAFVRLQEDEWVEIFCRELELAFRKEKEAGMEREEEEEGERDDEEIALPAGVVDLGVSVDPQLYKAAQVQTEEACERSRMQLSITVDLTCDTIDLTHDDVWSVDPASSIGIVDLRS
jgi:hypothetical protein